MRDVLARIVPVFEKFRAGFSGKASPVHFFWGNFDLAVTRFSGRTAPSHPGGVPGLPDCVTRDAYRHEVSSAGFWSGNAAIPAPPIFYSYAYPAPTGFRDAMVDPDAARFDKDLGEFALSYDAVATAANPEAPPTVRTGTATRWSACPSRHKERAPRLLATPFSLFVAP